MKFERPWLAWVCALVAFCASTSASAEVCQKERDGLIAAQRSMDQIYKSGLEPAKVTTASSSKSTSNDQVPPEEPPKRCDIGGTWRCETVLWRYKVDVPEVQSARKEWETPIPEVRGSKVVGLSADVPVSKCSTKKVGQYPEFRCEDTWIEAGTFKTKGVPKCATRWSDIKTDVCSIELVRKEVKVRVPQVEVAQRKFSFDNPEVKMKTREFSMHHPRCHLQEGCVGEACEKSPACQEKDVNLYGAKEKTRVEKFGKDIGSKQQNLVQAISQLYRCESKEVLATRKKIETDGKKYLGQSSATVEALVKAGLLDQAAQQISVTQQTMKAVYSATQSLDAQLERLTASHQKIVDTALPVSFEYKQITAK